MFLLISGEALEEDDFDEEEEEDEEGKKILLKMFFLLKFIYSEKATKFCISSPNF